MRPGFSHRYIGERRRPQSFPLALYGQYLTCVESVECQRHSALESLILDQVCDKNLPEPAIRVLRSGVASIVSYCDISHEHFDESAVYDAGFAEPRLSFEDARGFRKATLPTATGGGTSMVCTTSGSPGATIRKGTVFSLATSRDGDGGARHRWSLTANARMYCYQIPVKFCQKETTEEARCHEKNVLKLQEQNLAYDKNYVGKSVSRHNSPQPSQTFVRVAAAPCHSHE